MYSSDRSQSRQLPAHLPSSGHVCPLPSGNEPRTGLPGKTPQINEFIQQNTYVYFLKGNPACESHVKIKLNYSRPVN